jgi:hypothetical protein
MCLFVCECVSVCVCACGVLRARMKEDRILALPIHCPFTAHSLPIHCPFTAHSLPIRFSLGLLLHAVHLYFGRLLGYVSAQIHTEKLHGYAVEIHTRITCPA